MPTASTTPAKHKASSATSASVLRRSPYCGVFGALLAKWDRWIYGHALRSVVRMSHDHPALTYLLEVELRAHHAQRPLSETLRRSTEVFHEALIDLSRQRSTPEGRS